MTDRLTPDPETRPLAVAINLLEASTPGWCLTLGLAPHRAREWLDTWRREAANAGDHDLVYRIDTAGAAEVARAVRALMSDSPPFMVTYPAHTFGDWDDDALTGAETQAMRVHEAGYTHAYWGDVERETIVVEVWPWP